MPIPNPLSFWNLWWLSYQTSVLYSYKDKTSFGSRPIVLSTLLIIRTTFRGERIQNPRPLIPPSSHTDFHSEGPDVALDPPSADGSVGLGTTDLDQCLPCQLLTQTLSFLPLHTSCLGRCILGLTGSLLDLNSGITAWMWLWTLFCTLCGFFRLSLVPCWPFSHIFCCFLHISLPLVLFFWFVPLMWLHVYSSRTAYQMILNFLQFLGEVLPQKYLNF